VDVRSELHLKLDKNEPRRVAEHFEELALEHGVPMGIVFKFQLALDEILTNVVSYAFEDAAGSEGDSDDSDPSVRVLLHLTDDQVMALIEDNGRPFNPLQDAPVPDLYLTAEDRSIGGLGIHFTKAFVETLSYERRDAWNRLSLVQPLSAHSEENA